MADISTHRKCFISLFRFISNLTLSFSYAQSKKAKPNKLFAEFDTERFWEDVRRLSRNNLIFISEELAPSDFICVWQVDYRRGK